MTVAGPWAQQYRLGNGRIPPTACRGGGILRLVHKEVLMNISITSLLFWIRMISDTAFIMVVKVTSL
jgi:hypothetical protein